MSDAGDVLTCPVSAGTVKNTVSNLLKGKYTLSIEGLNNAILYVDNEALVERNAEGDPVNAQGKVETDPTKWVPLTSQELSVAENINAVSLEVKPIDKALNFELGTVSIKLEFNFATAKNTFDTSMSKIQLSEVIAEDTSDEAKALRTQQASLAKDVAAIQNRVDAIVLTDAEKLYEAYKTEELNAWKASKPGDLLSAAIAALTTSVNTYNEAVSAENTKYTNIQTNTAAYDAIKAQIAALRASLKEKSDVKVPDGSDKNLVAYAKNFIAQDVERIGAEIDAYEAAAAAAYKDLGVTVTFENKTSAIQTEIDAISYETAVADWNAYADFLKAYDTVTATYNKNFAAINNVAADVEEAYGKSGAQIYQDLISLANAALASEYNNNTGWAITFGEQTPDNVGIISGADAKLAGVEEAMKIRNAAMDKIYVDLKETVDTQQANLATAQAVIKDYQEKLDEKNSIFNGDSFDLLTEASQKIVKDAVAKIQQALTAFETEVEKEYLEHTLFKSEYTVKSDAVEVALTDYDNKTTEVGPSLDLIGWLEAAYAEARGEDFEKIFTVAYENIMDAIEAYQAAPDQTKFKDIKDAIDTLESNVKLIAGIYTQVSKTITDAQESLDELNSQIASAVIVELGGKLAYDTATFKDESGNTPAKYQKDINEYSSDFNAATGNEAAQDVYDALVALSEKIGEDRIVSALNQAKTYFAETVTAANLNMVQDAEQEIKDYTTTDPTKGYAGMDKVNTDIEWPKDYKGPKSIEDIITNINNAGSDINKLKECDNQLVAFAEKYVPVFDEINKVLDNHKAYEEVLALWNAANNNLQGANGLENLIPTITIAPAVEFYLGQVGNLKETAQAIYNDIEKSYNGLKAVADKDNLHGHIEDLVQDIKNLEAACRANDKEYKDQVNRATTATNAANELIDYFMHNDLVEENAQKYIDQVKKQLEALAAITVELTQEFGKGNSVNAGEDNFDERFKAIEEELANIKDNENRYYQGAVEDSNEKYLSQFEVLGNGYLDGVYTNAIEVTNYYRYDVKNTGLHAAIGKVLQKSEFNHEKFQECYDKINALNAKYAEFISNLTKGTDRDSWIVLGSDNETPSTTAALAELVSKANEIQNQINDQLTALNAAVRTAADNLYNTDHDSAASLISDIESRLTSVGITGDDLKAALKEINDKMKAAESGYKPAETDTEKFVQLLDGAMNYLDEINATDPDKYVNTACTNLWQTTYSSAETTLNKLETELEGYGFATDFEDLKAQFAEYKAAAAALNSYFPNIYNPETGDVEKGTAEGNFATLKRELKTILENAESLVSAAKTSNNANTLSQQIYTNLTATINTLFTDLDALREYTLYRKTQLQVVDAIELKIIKQQTVIESNKGKLDNTNKVTYENALKGIQNDIAAGYKTVFDQEVVYATSLVGIAREAFNNAKVNGAPTEKLEAWDKVIKEAQTIFSDGKTFVYDAKKKDQLRTDLLAQEDKILAVVAEMQGYYPDDMPTPEAGVITAITDMYNRLSELLENFKTSIDSRAAASGEYGATVKSEFGPKVDELISAAEGVMDDANAAGADVISDKDALIYRLTQIESQYNEDLANWEPAQNEADKKYKSDTLYTQYKATFDGYQTAIDNAKTAAEEHSVSYSVSDYTSISSAIESALESLESYKSTWDVANFRVNASIENNVNVFVRNTYYSTAYKTLSDVQSLIGTLQGEILNPENGEYLNAQEMIGALGELYDKSNTEIRQSVNEIRRVMIDDRYVSSTAAEALDRYNSCMEEIEALKTDVENVKSEAEESHYIVGDVNFDGKLTTADIQTLINWLLDDADLSDKQQAAADMNNSNSVNIGDVTALINEILGENSGNQARLKRFLPASKGNNSMTLMEVDSFDGNKRYAVVLGNEVDFCAGQLDIMLPAGARVVNISATERTDSHDILFKENDGFVRVLMTNMENALIKGNSGAILFIDVEGDAEVTVENGIFADRFARDYNVAAKSQSGIMGIYDSLKEGVKAIYNAAGQKLNRLGQGINIIRKSDGTTKKELKK